MVSSISNLDENTRKNKELSSVLYKRYGQSRSLAYNCLLLDYRDRLKSIYQWIKSGKLKQDAYLEFCEDFLLKQSQTYSTDDVDDMIRFIKGLR